MHFDFDTVVDRKNTLSLKYDFAEERNRPKDILPLWVADMDFPAAPGIIERLTQCISHGIYGYSEGKQEYFAALSAWYEKNFQWKTESSWLVKTPGVVYAIAAAVRAFTNPGDSVLIQSPVYYPFREVIEANDRKTAANSLILRNGHYEIDFADFEKQIREKQIRLFILCSPHNPVGRVWTKEELKRLGEICIRYQVKIVSDEIHSDFTWPGYQHTVFASLGAAYAENTITCTAPSKTFNLAGLQVSNIFISNPRIKKEFLRAIDQTGYSQLNLPGLVACQAAYETGAEWLTQLKDYLKRNLDYVRTFLKQEIPQIRLIEPEGTYLLWLDCRGLGLSDKELEKFMVEKANLWLDGGTMFGPEGAGFQRINIAYPKQTLEKALHQLKAALQ